MSHPKIHLQALPNVEFVHGYPGIPAGPDRPQATIKGAIEVRLGNQAVKAKWVKVELRKVETIPSGSHGEDFVDLVGQSPITVWQAQHEGETLSMKDFPFSIRVPETIPPSVALGRGAGIRYEVVATLCTKGKKGLLRREASTTTSHAVPVVIDKHELHSTWPIYAQAESRHVISDGLTLAVDRTHTCFAPADRLTVLATLKSDNLSPVVLRGFEFSLRETIIYRAGPHSHGKKNGPQVHTSILGEQKVPVSMTLYGGTQHKAELGCMIPGNHTTSSVNTGRHIDIGYTLNIKALLDKAKPVTMDLPVTITNWPRHVSADMIRRIGTAPNLSLQPTARPGVPVSTQPPDLRSSQAYGLSRPPVGSLPNIQNGNGGLHQTLPPSALVSGPPGSPIPSHAMNSTNTYSHVQQPFTMTGQAVQRPSYVASGQVPQSSSGFASRPDTISGHPSAAEEKAFLAARNDFPTPNPHGAPDEFGYNRQSTAVPTTAPSPPSEKHGFGVIDANQRHASMTSNRSSTAHVAGNDFGLGSDSSRMSQYTQDTGPRASTAATPTSPTVRRPRASSRPLKIVNANDDIPEEESPVKKTASKPFENISQTPSTQLDDRPVSPPASSTPWPTSEEEKQRLFEKAKARAEAVQARTKAIPPLDGSFKSHSPRPSNGGISPRPSSPSSPQQSSNNERPRTVSPPPVKSPWPTSEEEKQRLFEQAQAKARRTQSLAQSPPRPSNGSIAHSTHQRKTSAASSQDSYTNPALSPYVAASPPTLSAGAALYSHAMASMSRPATMIAQNSPPAHSTPRRTASHSAGSDARGNVPPPVRKYPTAEEEKAALRYLEARTAVDHRQREEASVPETVLGEEPIAYDALFPPGRSNDASSSTPNQGTAPQLPEKEILRRAYEVRDAAAAANQPPPPAPALLAMSARTPSPGGAVPPAPPEPSSEKEVLRKAFEARDAAMLRAGQIPQPAGSYLAQPTPPARFPSLTGGPFLSNTESKPSTPLSEKERMRRAFEARDRALAAQQQAPSPPDYDIPPPGSPSQEPSPPTWNDLGGATPLTAAEEKAQLKSRYAKEDIGTGWHAVPPAEPSPPVSQPQEMERPSPPGRESYKSDTSEVFLRRDPTISQGKKRASQMITPPPPSPPPPLPPPLLPRPPAEYIEETKLEDMKNNIPPAVTLPPDFSSSFDFGFDSFGNEKEAGSNSRMHHELRSD